MKRFLSSLLASFKKSPKTRGSLPRKRQGRLGVECLEGRVLMSSAPMAVISSAPSAPALQAQASSTKPAVIVSTQPAANATKVVQTTLVSLSQTPEPGTSPQTYVMDVAKNTAFPADYPFNVKVDNEEMTVVFGEDVDATTTQWHVVRTDVATHELPSHENGSLVTLVENGTPVENPPPATTVKPPTAPGSLTAVAKSTTQIQLSWDASEGATNYEVYVLTAAGWQQRAQLSNSVTEVTITGLAPNTTYQFYVTATNSAGQSASNHASAKTLAQNNPTSPSPLTGHAVSSTEISLAWNASLGAGQVRYRVFVNGKLQDNITTNSDNIEGLKPNTTYQFYVQAFNAYGMSQTATIKVSTLPTPPPAAHGYLGVEVIQIPANGLKIFGVSNSGAVYVQGIIPNSPAAAIGLDPGTIIVGFNNQPLPVNNPGTTMSQWIQNTKPGTLVTLKIIEDGQYKTVTVKIGAAAS